MPSERIQNMRSAHAVITEIPFEVIELTHGYANRALRIDLSTNDITFLPITEQMKDLWVGGKGFDLWLMFQEISRTTRWDSPENPICFSSGPLGGTTSFPGSGKTIVTALSPLTDSIMDSNVGGYFGPFFKFCGFDALVIVGKATHEVVVVIDAPKGRISIETAPHESIDSHVLAEELTEMFADNDIDKRNISVVSAGRGAEFTRMGILNFSFWDWRRKVTRFKQAGRGGIGRVFRDKKIKALVVKNQGITPAWRVAENKVAPLVTPKNLHHLTCKNEIDELTAIVGRWNDDPEYVIEMMQDIQDRFRHIPVTAIDTLCKLTGVPRSYLYHIATFFKAFSLEPKGETIIQVCMGTTCHVKGAARILDAFERELAIDAGQTTPDNKFSLEAVACLGACSIAPVVKLGEEVVGNVRARDVKKLLKHYGGPVSPTPETEEVKKPQSTTHRIGPADLQRISERIGEQHARYKGMLMVCTGTGCVSAKGFSIRDKLKAEIEVHGLSDQFLVVSTGCNGFCAMGPIVVVQPEGIFYQKIREGDVKDIVEQHLIEGKPVEYLMHTDAVTGDLNRTMGDITFFTKQELIALRNKGLVDPENIDHYIARDGYRALKNVLTDGLSGDAIVEEVIASGIRGRGGGGFPAGIKWKSGKKAAVDRKETIYVVCNADEGDPGAFMDRSIMETDPHSVIEGLCIGAFALGAREGYIYIRKEYPLAYDRLKLAIAQAHAYGLLGDSILGTDFSFDIHVHRGAGAFVCGESSALMASMTGRVGEPRSKYVHNVEYGFRGKPTVLNNVETWANIPMIILKGASWFAGIGTGDVSTNPWGGSSGTKVFSLVGDIRNTGLVEVPMGITLREIVEDVGGGIPDGRAFKAIQTGGPSGGCIPESMLDMPVDFDSLTRAGSMMGSGGMIVMDDKTCMVDVARYFVNFLVDESCGKCTPCREGLHVLNNTLSRICNGQGKPEDLAFLEEVSHTIVQSSLCQLGGTAPNPVLSTLRYFRTEYEEHIHQGKCRAGVCKPLITYAINDKCTGCLACIKPCPTGAITGEKKMLHVIDQEKCIKCGICLETCKFDAVEVK